MTIISLLVMAIGAAVAVFTPLFHDTLPQRIGLSGICIGSIGMAWWVAHLSDVPDPIVWMACSGGIYVIATAAKFINITFESMYS